MQEYYDSQDRPDYIETLSQEHHHHQNEMGANWNFGIIDSKMKKT